MICLYPRSLISPKDKETIIKVPCGKCIHCQINKSSNYAFRSEIELQHAISAVFPTFTISDENIKTKFINDIPEVIFDNEYIKKFFKNLRNNLNRKNYELTYPTVSDLQLYEDFKTLGLRYMVVPELGGKTLRPHWHALIFNLPFNMKELKGQIDCQKLLQKCWPYGHIYVGKVTTQSINYVAKYCVKDQDKRDSEKITKVPRVGLSKGYGLQYLTPEMIAFYKSSPPNKQYLARYNQKFPMGDYYKKKIFNEAELLAISEENQYNNALNPREQLTDSHKDQIAESIRRRKKRRESL